MRSSAKKPAKATLSQALLDAVGDSVNEMRGWGCTRRQIRDGYHISTYDMPDEARLARFADAEGRRTVAGDCAVRFSKMWAAVELDYEDPFVQERVWEIVYVAMYGLA